MASYMSAFSRIGLGLKSVNSVAKKGSVLALSLTRPIPLFPRT
jgi:hypothetical protein